MRKTQSIAALVIVSLCGCMTAEDRLREEARTLHEERGKLESQEAALELSRSAHALLEQMQVPRHPPTFTEDAQFDRVAFRLLEEQARVELSANHVRQQEIAARLDEIDRALAELN